MRKCRLYEIHIQNTEFVTKILKTVLLYFPKYIPQESVCNLLSCSQIKEWDTNQSHQVNIQTTRTKSPVFQPVTEQNLYSIPTDIRCSRNRKQNKFRDASFIKAVRCDFPIGCLEAIVNVTWFLPPASGAEKISRSYALQRFSNSLALG